MGLVVKKAGSRSIVEYAEKKGRLDWFLRQFVVEVYVYVHQYVREWMYVWVGVYTVVGSVIKLCPESFPNLNPFLSSASYLTVVLVLPCGSDGRLGERHTRGRRRRRGRCWSYDFPRRRRRFRGGYPQISLDKLEGSESDRREGPAPQHSGPGPRVEPAPADFFYYVEHATSNAQRTAAGGYAGLDDVDGRHSKARDGSGDGTRQDGSGRLDRVLLFGRWIAIVELLCCPLALELLVEDEPYGRRRDIPEEGRPVSRVQARQTLLMDDASNRHSRRSLGLPHLELLFDDLLWNKDKGRNDVAAGGRQSVDKEALAVAGFGGVFAHELLQGDLGGFVSPEVERRRGNRSQCRREDSPVDPLEGVLGPEHLKQGVPD